MSYYSQNDEDLVIVDYFHGAPGASPGRFLDVGAHDGVGFSNTRRLAELGWRGTLVEPSPRPFARLMENYAGRGDVDLVNVALVVGTPRLVLFHDALGDFVSTADEEHRRLWVDNKDGRSGAQGMKYQPIYVSGIPPGELLERFPGPYDFVNIDVEGTNGELFAGFPSFRSLGTRLICVEYVDRFERGDETLSAMRVRAEEQGFRLIHRTGENAIFAL